MGSHCRQAYDGLTKEMEEVRTPLHMENLGLEWTDFAHRTK